jgi:TonB family protein
MLEPLFNTPILYSLALTLLHFLWQGLLISAALKLALLLIDKSKPQLRYALCALAMIANLLVAIITFNIITPESLNTFSSSVSQIPLTSLVNELTQQSPLISYPELLPSILAYILPYISLGWLAIVFILVCKILIEIRNVNLLPKYGSTLPNDKLQHRFIELTKQINLRVVPQLLISIKAEVPMAIGFIKPVVLIPATMVTGLTSSQLEMLILHELAHIRRHDYLVNFLQTIIEILFFFHPSVHWVAKNMRNEREYCSDDIAVKHCGDPIAYAHTLTDTASLCINHQHTIPSMAMAASGGDLKQRVVRLVDHHHCTPKNDLGKWFAAISLLLLIATFSMNQLLSSANAQQWTHNLPWQKQHPVQSVNQHGIAFPNDALEHILNNKNDSIAQQLLTNKNQETKILTVIKETDKTAAKLPTSLLVNENVQGHTPYLSMENISNLPSKKVSNEQSAIQINSGLSNNTSEVSNPVKESTLNQSAHDFTTELAGAESDSTMKVSSLLSLDTPVEHKNTKLSFNKPEIINNKVITVNHIQENDLLTMKVDYLENNDTYQKHLNELSTLNPYQHDTSPYDEKLVRQFKQSSGTQKSINKSLREYRAKQLKLVDPVYPSLAKRKGIEIEVKVQFTIDKNGEVKNISFTRQSRLNYFKSSIRTAMRKWRFSPARINNRAVESKMTKIFSFSLQG